MGEWSKNWESDVIKASTYAIISELSKLRVQLRRTSAKPRNTCSWRLTFPVVKDRFNYLCLRVSFCFYSAYFDSSSPLVSLSPYHAPAQHLSLQLSSAFFLMCFFLSIFISFLSSILLAFPILFLFTSFLLPFFLTFLLSKFLFKPPVLSSLFWNNLSHPKDEIFSISYLPFYVKTNRFCEVQSIAHYMLFPDLHWSATIVRDVRIESTLLVLYQNGSQTWFWVFINRLWNIRKTSFIWDILPVFE